jgi:hypothetical protein
VSACQNQSVPLLTDPNAILQAAVASTISATSVRIDLSAEGELVVDPLGTGAGAPISIRGTTASADVDLAGGDARATFAAPGLLGLAGELIAAGGTVYLKSTLSGPQFQVVATGDDLPGASPDRTTLLTGLTDFLAQPGLDPVKGDDVPCGTGTCYVVTVQLTADELAALGVDALPIPSGLPIPLPDLTDAAIGLTIRVDQASTRLAGLTAAMDLADAGNVTAEFTFTKWDEPVSIEAPPPDQVAPAG